MSSTEAQKRAVKKWTDKRDNITIRIEKDTGSMIRASAAAAGLSVTQYILDRVNGEGVASDDPLKLDYPAIREHTEKTGETVPGFVNRAVRDTIDRDNAMLKMGLPINKGESQ